MLRLLCRNELVVTRSPRLVLRYLPFIGDAGRRRIDRRDLTHDVLDHQHLMPR